MPEPVISVRGEANLEVQPEIAIVWVSVQARDADRHRAVELLARRSGAVSSTIKGFGEAVEKLESKPVNVQPVFKDGKARERISGYLAQAGFTVTVREFAVLGDFVTGLADALIFCKARYGSAQSVALIQSWLSALSHAAYRASAAVVRR